MKRLLLLALLISLPASAQYYGRRGPLPPPVFTLKGSSGGSAPFAVTGVSTSGPSLILVTVHWTWSSTVTVTTVTVSGNNAIQKVRQENATFQGAEIWSYWSPVALSNVTVNVDTSPSTNGGITVVEAARTTAGSPGNTGTGSGNGTTELMNPNVAVSFTNSRLIGACSNLGGTGTPGTGTYTELADFTDGGVGYFQVGHANTFTTAGEQRTVSWTIPSATWACVGLEVKPAQ